MFKKIRGLFSTDVAIDLGTANTLVYMQGKGIVLNEPSVVAMRKGNNNRTYLAAVGFDAKQMLGRTPEHIEAIRPVRDGVIYNLQATEKMLQYFINKVHKDSFFHPSPRVLVGIPCRSTEVEIRAIREAVLAAGAREVHLILEPMAAALGAGLPVGEPAGSMVVDIGGGTTEIAIIALGGVVVSDSVRIGGDTFDEAIISYIRRNHGILIGEGSAEKIKLDICSAVVEGDRRMLEVRGRNVAEGAPQSVALDSTQIHDAIVEPLHGIVNSVKKTLELAPPELSSDIGASGIMLTGGGALLRDIDRFLTEHVYVPVHVAESPLDCVVRGGGMALDMLDIVGSPDLVTV